METARNSNVKYKTKKILRLGGYGISYSISGDRKNQGESTLTDRKRALPRKEKQIS